jgi:hypothetical protein
MLISRSHEPGLDKNSALGLSVQQFIVGNGMPTNMITEAIWLMETSRLPAIGQNYSGIQAISLIDTLLLPATKLTAKGKSGGNKLKPIQLQHYIP